MPFKIVMPLVGSPGAHNYGGGVRSSQRLERASELGRIGETSDVCSISGLEAELGAVSTANEASICRQKPSPVRYRNTGQREKFSIMSMPPQRFGSHGVSVGAQSHHLRLLKNGHTCATRQVLGEVSSTYPSECFTEDRPFVRIPSRPFVHGISIRYYRVFSHFDQAV
jgi:hypothetical protein